MHINALDGVYDSLLYESNSWDIYQRRKSKKGRRRNAVEGRPRFAFKSQKLHNQLKKRTDTPRLELILESTVLKSAKRHHL